MTRLSQLLAFFPALIIALSGLSFLWLCLSNSWIVAICRLLLLLFIFYGLPVLTYQIHSYFHPLKEGISYLKGKKYSPWWGSHQIQAIYIAFPLLETGLRLVPGLFSIWLRLWGADIGKQIYWGSMGEISDRGLLKVCDRARIGHRVGFYAHIIKPKKQNLLLYVKRIEIGEGAFIGSGCYIGAGVTVAPEGYLEAGSEIHPNQSVTTNHRQSPKPHTNRFSTSGSGTASEVDTCAE